MDDLSVLDITSPVSKKRFEAGSVLVLEGTTAKAMNILHSGLAELLYYGGEDIGSCSPEDIVSRSRRVGLIRGESVYGILGIRNDGPYRTSIRAVTDCIVSIHPVEQDRLLTTLQSKITFNLQVLRAINQRIESAVYLFRNYKYLWHKFASIADSLALAVPLGQNAQVSPKEERGTSRMEEYAAYLRVLADRQKRSFPSAWDHNVFLGRLQQDLGLYREYDELNIETMVDYSQVLFIKRLVQKPDSVLVPLFKDDEPMNFYVFQFLCDVLEKLLEQNVQLIDSINELIVRLYADDGWIAHALSIARKDPGGSALFTHYLEKFSWRCRQDAGKLLGIDLEAVYPVFASLKKFRTALSEQPASAAHSDLDTGMQKAEPSLAKYEGLLDKLIDFAGMNDAFREEMHSNLRIFKSWPDKSETGSAKTQIRNTLNTHFWKLYKTCFLKVIDTDLKGFIPGILLHFGLLDETLVSKDELMFIDRAYSRNFYSDESIPVMTLPYFLEKVYKSEVHPSMTEMGESFRNVLKSQEKYSPSQKAKATLYQDTAEDRVKFEIDKIAADTSKLLFGSKQKAVPFLFSEGFLYDMSRELIDPEKLLPVLEEYHKRDFSVFYREVVLRHTYGTDIIKKEVAPQFVLFPGAGSRCMLWQELDGVRKDTPGRVFFPLFFHGDINESVLHVFAQFRWELQKVIAGVKWTDPVEGGLVGTYYDYINFYKRNPKLTPQAKADLREFIQKTKSDKDRFVHDYSVWLNYEYEGRLRMNPVAREIFYRFCPFPQEVRKEMAAKPLFGDLDMKYKNRIRKETLRAETRKKRFENSPHDVPEDLERYLQFLNM
ncbi:MAG: cyclic nucleotide-binding domain-containing protein [Spirochaetales bacterium]|nr:cyclic nucleotide-binding domain-containing protein [Spirochaetales bacterium]